MRWTVGRVLVVAVVGGLTASTVQTSALAEANASNVHHVTRTDGDGLWLHSAPSLTEGLLTVMPEGADFTVDCWATGDLVLGNPIWLRGHFGGQSGYAADYYIDTQWQVVAELTAQGIPQCGTEAPATEPPTPVSHDAHIVLGTGAGQHETDVAALEDRINAAAAAVGINGQTLARIIYHEGGNYFSPRRGATELAELNYTGSVGIGQIQIGTARLVDLQVYQDWEMVQEPSDLVVRSRLIYDWDYAIRTAAGYVALLQRAGIEGDWPLFMAYSLDIQTAVDWKAAGHPMDWNSLANLGISNTADFIQRQQYFNDAAAAIG